MQKAEFDDAFAELRDALRSYLFRLTTNPDEAEDLVQDTYVRAARAIGGFSGRSSLRTWVFTIATNLARDHFRVRQRWAEDIQDRCRSSTQARPDRVARMRTLTVASPVERYEFKEHIDYCFTCIGKSLTLEQQLAILLKDVYGFTVDEAAEIVGITRGRFRHALADGRHAMEDIFDGRCVLVSKTGVCHQCSEIQGWVNPKQEAREKELELVREARSGADRQRLLRLRAALVRSVDPLAAPAAEMHAWLLSLMEEHAEPDPDVYEEERRSGAA